MSNHHRQPWFPILAALVVLATGTIQADVPESASPTAVQVLSASGPPSVAIRPDGPEIVRKRYVVLDAYQAMRGSVLDLGLFPDVRFRAERSRAETLGADGRLWVGRIAGTGGSVVLTSVGDVVVGNVRVGRQNFQIRYAGEEIHVVSQVDASEYPPEGCAENTPAPPPPLSREEANVILADPCDLIDMLVLYTPSARATAGGHEAMRALIYLAVAETNISYEDSDVNHRVQPVHIAEISYTESGGSVTDRNRLKDPSDGFMDDAHDLREAYCADVVALVEDTGDWCGYSYTQDPAPDPGHEDRGFYVVKDNCATGNFTFGHELGHIMGARHDWYKDDSTTPYTHSHAVVDTANRWRTIMGYNHHCEALGFDCVRLGIWSNPGVDVSGDPAGVASGTSTSCVTGDTGNPDCDAENWRVLNDTACTVANFRDRSACEQRADVWMKDTWADTGDEPDPLTAGGSMHESPYIWVRLEQDAEGLHQHQHENPEFGQTNFVYTKLHNDYAGAASGQLKLYWAHASTGLRWPEDWTLIADRPVNIAANDTRIAEMGWNPPGQGHYCLLARWTQPNTPNDPMTHPEGHEVHVNVRNNNNIVWHNVNIVNADPNDAMTLAPVIVRLIDPQLTIFDLLVRLPDSDHNFVRRGGDVLLDLGELYQPWRDAGGNGIGVQDLGTGQVRILNTATGTAEILGIPTEYGKDSQVRFTFTAPAVFNVPRPDADDEGSQIRLCSAGGEVIPDGAPAGVVSPLHIRGCFLIDDLDLSLQTSHTWVGDLSYTLRHVDTGTTVTVLDRPGVPASTYGCSGDDVDVLLDDDAAFPAESWCETTSPAIGGALVPGDPPDHDLFAPFRGEETCGDWELTVVDHASSYTGTVGPWCLALSTEIDPPRPVTDYAVDLIQRDEAGDEVGGVGYRIHVRPEGGAGSVPDGGNRPGDPLRIVRLPGGDLRLTWGDSCMSSVDTDYAVYEGTLGDFNSHRSMTCSTGGAPTTEVTPRSGSAYYLVVPNNGYYEGSHGTTGDGIERDRGPDSLMCHPQDAGGC